MVLLEDQGLPEEVFVRKKKKKKKKMDTLYRNLGKT